MNTRTAVARSPWYDALVAVVSIAVVSAVAVVKDWSFGSWAGAAGVCVFGGIFSATMQVRRNRRIDRAVRQARVTDARPEFTRSSR